MHPKDQRVKVFIMRIKKILEKKGFKHLLIKSLMFVFFLVFMQVLCAPLAKAGAVPGEFKPFSFLQVGEALLFTLMLFVIYNRKRLLDVDTYKLRIRDMAFLPLALLQRHSSKACIPMPELTFFVAHFFFVVSVGH